LTIFAETEILFHFAGYNGELYQTLFNDLFSLINEINLGSRKKLGKSIIHLKYFSEVKAEIERFFKKAEYIISGHEKANPSKTAMTTILDGCKTPADIIEKKTRFYELLKGNRILEDDYQNYYSGYNHKYNIEDKELLRRISERTGIEDLSIYLRFLNYVNIHRKGISDTGFEKVGYILLSGTATTLLLAWDEDIKTDGNIPLASHLGFLTNKFWFRLNKGFGKGEYLKSFDVVTKAQIVLSTLLNNSVGEKFEELQFESRSGNITEEQAISSIAELRRQAKKPEDINELDVEDVLKSIEESSIEKYLEEQEYLKNNVRKREKENIQLKEELEKKNKELLQKQQAFEETIRKREKENSEKETELARFRQIEKEKSEKKNKRIQLLKRVGVIFLILVLIAGGVLLYIYCNKLVGIIIGTIAGVFTILTFFRIDYKSILRVLRRN
jgi:hypothetical protein